MLGSQSPSRVRRAAVHGGGPAQNVRAQAEDGGRPSGAVTWRSVQGKQGGCSAGGVTPSRVSGALTGWEHPCGGGMGSSLTQSVRSQAWGRSSRGGEDGLLINEVNILRIRRGWFVSVREGS